MSRPRERASLRPLLALLLLGAAPPGGHAPSAVQEKPAVREPPTFGASTEMVYVDAFVTRGGEPVRGLDAASFRLEDNGEPQKVELVAVETLPLVALLVFDASGSVKGPKIEALRSASEAFLAGLRPQDEIGLLFFSHELFILARPTQDRDPVRNALSRLEGSGATALWDAVFSGLTLLPTRARSLVVVFSDGEDNMSWLREEQVRAAAERSNALLHAVGLRAAAEAIPLDPIFRRNRSPPPEPDHVRALRQTAEATGGRFWEAETPGRVQAAFASIVAAMNTRYVLRYEPVRPKPGWHRIELRLQGEKGDVRTRRGYWNGAPR